MIYNIQKLVDLYYDEPELLGILTLAVGCFLCMLSVVGFFLWIPLGGVLLAAGFLLIIVCVWLYIVTLWREI